MQIILNSVENVASIRQYRSFPCSLQTTVTFADYLPVQLKMLPCVLSSYNAFISVTQYNAYMSLITCCSSGFSMMELCHPTYAATPTIQSKNVPRSCQSFCAWVHNNMQCWVVTNYFFKVTSKVTHSTSKFHAEWQVPIRLVWFSAYWFPQPRQ